MTGMVREQVRRVIRTYGLIEAGDQVLLGFSGGPDSLCLFDVLCDLREELGFTLACIHVNHGLRPGEAEEDQRFVETVCKERGVDLSVCAADCAAAARSLGLTEEEAGRRLRYEAFDRRAAALAAQGAAPRRVRIAVAQNRNDQAETVLQRLLRGTGTDGLAGMDYVRTGEEGFAVIRPLLDTDRADIEAYLSARGLAPRRDRTNEENTYVRNRIRNELLPYLAGAFNPNITEALTRAAANAREDSAYLKTLAEERFFDAQTAAGEIPLPPAGTPELKTAGALFDRVNMDLNTVLAAPLPIRHRVLRLAFERIGLTQDIAAVHIAAMDRLIEEGRTSSETSLPGGYVMRIGYGVIECLTPAGQPAAEKEGEGTAPNGSGRDAAAMCRAAVYTREELLALIGAKSRAADGVPAEEPAAKALSEEEMILSYIYSKNFSGINEAACVLDADKTAALLAVPWEELRERIEFRPRRPGDRLPLKEGSKSIQDLMVDEKIPKDRRNHILLAAAGSVILCVPGGMPRPRCAAGCTAGRRTQRFLVLEMDRYVW